MYYAKFVGYMTTYLKLSNEVYYEVNNCKHSEDKDGLGRKEETIDKRKGGERKIFCICFCFRVFMKKTRKSEVVSMLSEMVKSEVVQTPRLIKSNAQTT